MNKIKTAIVGYGRSGQLLHGQGLLKNAEDYEVVAVCDRADPCLDQAKQDFGCEVFKDLNEMLTQVKLDLVIIVTRNDQHYSMALDALNAGCDIMVTKPLATTGKEVLEIKEAAEKNGRTVYPFLPCRWASDVRRIREIVKAGLIGEVFNIRRAAYGFATRDDWQTKSEFGGGILLNWGPHLVDSPLYILEEEPKTVYGATSQLLNPGDVEDNYFSHITLEDGVRVFSEWSFSPADMPHWFVQGTGGCIVVNDRELKLYRGTPSKPADPTDPKAMAGGGVSCEVEELNEHIYGDSIEVYADLARAIRGEKTFLASIDDALRIANVIDAVKESQVSQTLIQL